MRTFLSMKRFLLIFLMLPVLFLVTCKKGEKIEIRTEDGVIVVYNPKNPAPPRGLKTFLSVREDLSLGAKGESEESMLLEPAVVDVDDPGNIYVLDRKAVQIKVFDPQGKFVRTIGRHGQGPGEFQSARYFQITPQNNILVLDAMGRRLTLVDLDGLFIRDIPAGLWNLSVSKMDNNGDIIGTNIKIEQEAFYELIRFNQNLEQVQTITRILVGKMPVFNPYFPNLIYALTPDGKVLWGTTTGYEFKIVSREGKTVKRIVKKYDPQIISEEDRVKKAKEMWDSENPPADMKVEWPRYFPPVQDFILDDRGWLFVRPFAKERQAKGVLYDVFDTEGRYVARTFLPAVARRIKTGKLYTIEEDAEGLLHVKRYTLEWK